jgi:hypothetical protein
MPRRDNPGFDEDVVRFVLTDLRTVWTLELLLLMRAAPEKIWTAAALTRELRASLPMVEDILRRLEILRLIGREAEGWAYRPATSDLDGLCVRTDRAYRQKPFAMISLIGRAESVLRDLANAFRLRDKES